MLMSKTEMKLVQYISELFVESVLNTGIINHFSMPICNIRATDVIYLSKLFTLPSKPTINNQQENIPSPKA